MGLKNEVRWQMVNNRAQIIVNESALALEKGDITQSEAEAIVNAANSSLMGGGGVDGAIHRAGGPAILEECKRIVARSGSLPPGQAVITAGGRLKARYVIHTVGPIWHGGGHGEAEVLADCYANSLKLAADHQLTSVTFPSVSTGAYGYPVEAAARIALETVAAFLGGRDHNVKIVTFVLFDARTYDAYRAALENVRGQKA
jgi:O-acetyl-ADP-ribose deacetylase